MMMLRLRLDIVDLVDILFRRISFGVIFAFSSAASFLGRISSLGSIITLHKHLSWLETAGNKAIDFAGCRIFTKFAWQYR